MERKHRIYKIVAIITAVSFLALSGYGYSPNTGAIAIVTKVIKEVTKKTSSADWVEAAIGDRLSTGDQVKTGSIGFALIKFTDNSLVRLRNLSQLTVVGEGTRGAAIRTADLNRGSVGFTIKKQQNNIFRLTSPTSVASIRGTKGKWSSADGFDTLVVTEGLVSLRNNVSNKEVDVPEGSIGFSNADGSISSRPANDSELADANNAADGGTSHEMKLELKDSKGNKKDLKLKFKQ